MLAELGANVETPTKGGFTPVYRGAERPCGGGGGVARAGANVETPEEYGATPVYITGLATWRW